MVKKITIIIALLLLLNTVTNDSSWGSNKSKEVKKQVHVQRIAGTTTLIIFENIVVLIDPTSLSNIEDIIGIESIDIVLMSQKPDTYLGHYIQKTIPQNTPVIIPDEIVKYSYESTSKNIQALKWNNNFMIVDGKTKLVIDSMKGNYSNQYKTHQSSPINNYNLTFADESDIIKVCWTTDLMMNAPLRDLLHKLGPHDMTISITTQ